ncbi:lipopolysaccharide kinase InaA family protein [Propionivibrio sp.]|uniref:lipopolysaccharide kinase InaA family protein n=1 Tax=Propionivibrio sp. TaxID=2212460 RepID=UPI0025FE0A8E|nr:lipopolysaccharide kinase InaA family protein [Propionivibrio sp.]MBK7355699.1 lipopolysaccharide kinase [Propionivibrio sp.]MBK8400637.1 lipopolysaccharide kinase [Propionivibrio sp.]MBK8744290.1 lipopolysaccharide kinase [Propionivibrio sp.]MBK8895099.1 lipopolysaccharide kinase [Propionivibrio sp.]MBL0206996.1 lipopolysaccharide kinase [Propionivibrio sp.]
MKVFINERWRSILTHNGLSDFDALWKLEADWFEEPNFRRGGWSGVSRCELNLPEGGKCAIFLKRQENHRARLWTHPIHGAPTFLREFRHIIHYRKCGVPTLEPVYFAMRKVGKDHRAILVTEELTGFVSMEDRVQTWLKEGAPPRAVRLGMLAEISKLLRTMHEHGIQHNCFFPKHVFARINPDKSVDVRVIDLEKSRWRPSKTVCAIRDLYTLNYHSLCWSRTDRLWFFKSYLELTRLTSFAKWLWRTVTARSVRKGRVSAQAPRLLSVKEK